MQRVRVAWGVGPSERGEYTLGPSTCVGSGPSKETLRVRGKWPEDGGFIDLRICAGAQGVAEGVRTR